MRSTVFEIGSRVDYIYAALNGLSQGFPMRMVLVCSVRAKAYPGHFSTQFGYDDVWEIRSSDAGAVESSMAR